MADSQNLQHINTSVVSVSSKVDWGGCNPTLFPKNSNWTLDVAQEEPHQLRNFIKYVMWHGYRRILWNSSHASKSLLLRGDASLPLEKRHLLNCIQLVFVLPPLFFCQHCLKSSSVTSASFFRLSWPYIQRILLNRKNIFPLILDVYQKEEFTFWNWWSLNVIRVHLHSLSMTQFSSVPIFAIVSFRYLLLVFMVLRIFFLNLS